MTHLLRVMHRWFGSSHDSDRQASERDQRHARRILQEQQQLLNLDDSDDEYRDCDLSSSFLLNVDGVDDEPDMAAEAAAAADFSPFRV